MTRMSVRWHEAALRKCFQRTCSAGGDEGCGWDDCEVCVPRVLWAEIDRLRKRLYECWEITGADTSGGIPTWPDLGTLAVESVRELVADYKQTAGDDHALRAEIERLRAFCRFVVDLDDPRAVELRRTITLTALINDARAALSEKEADRG